MRPANLLEILAWTVGSVALATYGAARYSQQEARAEGLERFDTARSRQAEMVNSNGHLDSALEPLDTSTWSRKRMDQYQEAIHDDVTPEGVLRISSVRLRVPIYTGTSERNLNRGAGRIEGTARLDEPGNIGIAAHRDGFFRVLEKVSVGDVLSIERTDGIQDYRITNTLIVEPTDVSVLQPTGHSTVTLVTCYPFYFVGAAPRRFIVRAMRIDSHDSLGATDVEPTSDVGPTAKDQRE